MASRTSKLWNHLLYLAWLLRHLAWLLRHRAAPLRHRAAPLRHRAAPLRHFESLTNRFLDQMRHVERRGSCEIPQRDLIQGYAIAQPDLKK
jgi:hypothetical protein